MIPGFVILRVGIRVRGLHLVLTVTAIRMDSSYANMHMHVYMLVPHTIPNNVSAPNIVTGLLAYLQ